jgi:hypothetical protein
MTRWILNLHKGPPPRRAEARRPPDQVGGRLSPPRKSAGGGMEQASRESSPQNVETDFKVLEGADGATAQGVRRWSAGKRWCGIDRTTCLPVLPSRRAGRTAWEADAFRRSTAAPDGRRFRRLPPKASGRTDRPRNLRAARAQGLRPAPLAPLPAPPFGPERTEGRLHRAGTAPMNRMARRKARIKVPKIGKKFRNSGSVHAGSSFGPGC